MNIYSLREHRGYRGVRGYRDAASVEGVPSIIRIRAIREIRGRYLRGLVVAKEHDGFSDIANRDIFQHEVGTAEADSHGGTGIVERVRAAQK